MFYHIRISQKSNLAKDETKVDLSKDELLKRFITPYENGNPIMINGKTISPNDIERIRISKSDNESKYIIRQIKSEDRASSVIFLGGPSYEWKAAAKADEITDELVLGPPGYKRGIMEKSTNIHESLISTKKFFIVHGHDLGLKNDTEIFLRDIGLEPIVLHRMPDKGLTIIEKFEEYSDVGYALVLLTPDDVFLDISEIDKKENDRTYLQRARQNVIFELGYFVGKLGRSKVFYIYKEGVEIPSDLHGLIYKVVRDNIQEVGYALIKEFKTAGLTPNV